MTTLVLLPGMDGTGDLFAPFVAALGSSVQIKIVSYPTNQPLTYSELEDLVRAELPANDSYVILGESFSGPIAVSLAASQPSGLKGLVLCCTFVRNPRPVFSVLKPWIRLLPVTPLLLSAPGVSLLGRFSTPALRHMLAQALKPVTTAVWRTRLQSVLQVDVSDKLAHINIPVLSLEATHDHVVPRSAFRLLKQLKPDIHTASIHAPHLLLQTAPNEAAQIVTRFIAAL